MDQPVWSEDRLERARIAEVVKDLPSQGCIHRHWHRPHLGFVNNDEYGFRGDDADDDDANDNDDNADDYEDDDGDDDGGDLVTSETGRALLLPSSLLTTWEGKNY